MHKIFALDKAVTHIRNTGEAAAEFERNLFCFIGAQYLAEHVGTLCGNCDVCCSQTGHFQVVYTGSRRLRFEVVF